MHFTVSFDPLHFLGLLVSGYVASLVGSLLGIIVVAIFTPSLDGQRVWKSAALLNIMASMTSVKISVAFVVAAMTMALCSTIGAAWIWTMSITAIIGFAFTLIYGLTSNV